ncbi:hypothetical protein K466DRAFT_587682 [Polyporus arcularius HHB13444]|uniref:DUF6533 domain-containing protein n=1 Tax=Polyporus arcularius HHB13444 TaxID=1314778 RepID=A0A5C3PCG3_9APHY|nr:hypothetical protein K466DRAFT_587682 [Polyporus arcularius HHB13444]
MPFDASELEIIFVNNCFAVAALIVISYDYLLTLSTEIEYTRKLLRLNLIYILVRYTALVAQILLVIHLEPWKPVGSAEKCVIAVHLGDAMNIVNGLVCAVLTVLRAYAVSHHSKPLAVLVALACFMNPALFLAEAIGIRVLPIDTLGLDQCVGVLGSQTLEGSARSTYLATTITASVGDIITCYVVIVKLAPPPTQARVERSLSDVLYWDAVMGLLTLAANMLVNLVLVIIYDKVYNNPTAILFFRAWAIFYPVVGSISITHLLPELQEVRGYPTVVLSLDDSSLHSSDTLSVTSSMAFRDPAESSDDELDILDVPRVRPPAAHDPESPECRRDTSPSRPDPFPVRVDPETGSVAFDCSSRRDWKAELGEASFPAQYHWDNGPFPSARTRSYSPSFYAGDSVSTLDGVELVVEYR